MGKVVNLFIIGVNKAGSSWLYYLLDSHPDIFMTKVKEPDYFGKKYPEDLDKYHRFFDLDNDCKYHGEATPTYFFNKTTAEQIKAYSPNAKILAIVRDPVQRMVSQFYFRKQISAIEEGLSLENAIKIHADTIVAASHYERFFPHFEGIFGENFKLLSLEKAKSNLPSFWRELQEYLEVDPIPYHDSHNKPENPTGSKMFRWVYRSIIMRIKKNKQSNYEQLLQSRIMRWLKLALLKVLGTSQKEEIPEKLMIELKAEFQPTYEYLAKMGFADYSVKSQDTSQQTSTE